MSILTYELMMVWQAVAINLSAPFIPQFFKAQLEQILPYCDFVIGNDSEAAAYAESTGLAVSHNIHFRSLQIADKTSVVKGSRHRRTRNCKFHKI